VGLKISAASGSREVPETSAPKGEPMTHTHNELADQLPDFADRIHELKQSDRRFARLADEYHELNRQVHRMETNIEPTADEEIEKAKKQRLKLLDEIQSMLSASPAS